MKIRQPSYKRTKEIQSLTVTKLMTLHSPCKHSEENSSQFSGARLREMVKEKNVGIVSRRKVYHTRDV